MDKQFIRAVPTNDALAFTEIDYWDKLSEKDRQWLLDNQKDILQARTKGDNIMNRGGYTTSLDTPFAEGPYMKHVIDHMNRGEPMSRSDRQIMEGIKLKVDAVKADYPGVEFKLMDEGRGLYMTSDKRVYNAVYGNWLVQYDKPGRGLSVQLRNSSRDQVFMVVDNLFAKYFPDLIDKVYKDRRRKDDDSNVSIALDTGLPITYSIDFSDIVIRYVDTQHEAAKHSKAVDEWRKNNRLGEV